MSKIGLCGIVVLVKLTAETTVNQMFDLTRLAETNVTVGQQTKSDHKWYVTDHTV